MRFLLFNVVVIAALVYLFAVERDEPSMAIAQLQEELRQVEALALDALEPVVQAAPPAPRSDVENLDTSTETLLAELPLIGDPAVEQRRREVLDGLDHPAAAPPIAAEPPIIGDPGVVLAEGESLMSPDERVKQLHALAEEMELLFVESLSE